MTKRIVLDWDYDTFTEQADGTLTLYDTDEDDTTVIVDGWLSPGPYMPPTKYIKVSGTDFDFVKAA